MRLIFLRTMRRSAVFISVFFFVFQAFAQSTPLAQETDRINRENAALSAQIAAMRTEVNALRLKQATVQFVVDYKGTQGFGTGVVVGSSDVKTAKGYPNYVLTANHVVNNPRDGGPLGINAVLYNQKSKKTGTAPAELIYTNPSKDLALVAVYTGKQLSSMPIASANFKPKVGDAVIAVGCRKGNPPKIYTDADSCVAEINNPLVTFGNIQISCDANDGDSGGPLASKDGVVIGICHAKMGNPYDRDAAGPGVYINTAEINAFLAKAGQRIPTIGMEGGRVVNVPPRDTLSFPPRRDTNILPIAR